MKDERRHYIDGRWTASVDGRDQQVEDPSTEATIATITLGGPADVEAAVAAARAALTAWSTTPSAQRIAALERLLAIYRRRSEDMAQAISAEMGSPIALARTVQVDAGAEHLCSTIRVARDFAFERPLGEHAPGDMLLYEPVGVCALITPWNWPMNQVMLKVAPALAAGCTMVLKPSELSPLSALLLADMIDEIGLPAGVFNLVNGDGAGAGSALSAHPHVDMVSFTGSTRAGVAISVAAAASIKRVSLELGGKGANLVFADADDDAVTRGVQHCFDNSGQSCDAPTRMLVERSAYAQAVATARTVAERTVVGPAAVDGERIGPLVSATHWCRVQELIDSGIAQGATCIAGGPGRPDGLERGHFVRPTIFCDVTPHMRLWHEEVFGPVLCMTPFDSEDEAVALANDTPYGLTNYVQSADRDRARRVARRLRSGMVQLNGRCGSIDTPFGGMKQSGNGREGGAWGLEEYLEIKAVSDWQ